MKRSFLKKAGAFALTLSLAMGIFAMPAQAASGTETVYVITKISAVSQMDDGTDPFSVDPTTYTYTKKGLLKTTATPWSTLKYNYDGKQLTDIESTPTENDGIETGSTYELTYDSKDRIKKCEYSATYSDGTKGGYVNTYKYDSKNNIKSKTSVYGGDVDQPSTYEYTYNKKGQLTKEISVSSDIVTKYTYNKKGNVKKTVARYTIDGETEGYDSKFTYTYDKHGNVKTRVSVTEYINDELPKSTNTTTYTYKKLTVKKSLVETIKEQQEKIYKEELLVY